jgi:CO dehydrogenase/acetyl-CoA synthase alpha subunit
VNNYKSSPAGNYCEALDYCHNNRGNCVYCYGYNHSHAVAVAPQPVGLAAGYEQQAALVIAAALGR